MGHSVFVWISTFIPTSIFSFCHWNSYTPFYFFKTFFSYACIFNIDRVIEEEVPVWLQIFIPKAVKQFITKQNPAGKDTEDQVLNMLCKFLSFNSLQNVYFYIVTMRISICLYTVSSNTTFANFYLLKYKVHSCKLD